MKPKAIIVDIDGTLANCDHRRVYDEKGKLDWATFNGRMHMDTPNEWCLALMRSMRRTGSRVLLVTGRDEKYRNITKTWLGEHEIFYDGFSMRSHGDGRPDHEVKEEILKTKILPHYDVLFAVDDRKSVTDMWRRNGIVCLQCAEGNY